MLSYNSGMAGPIVTIFGVGMARGHHAAMHIPQIMGGVHLHVRSWERADVPQCFVARERLDGLLRNLVCG